MPRARTPLVHLKDGAVFANSRDVASFFGKRHKNVLQSIDGVDCSPEFGRLNFQPTSYTDTQGRSWRSVDMTKDGFTFLVMGFTGSEAGRFKEAYIDAFNRMEAEIKRQTPALPDFSDPVAAARAWAEDKKGGMGHEGKRG